MVSPDLPPSASVTYGPEGEVSFVGPYHLSHEVLGKGANAVVKMGTHQTTGARVAIKLINKIALQKFPRKIRRLEREIRALELMRHPHISRLIDFIETDQLYVLVLEFVGGKDLCEFLEGASGKGPDEDGGRRSSASAVSAVSGTGSTGTSLPQWLSVRQVFLMFYQLVSAVEYCHACGVAHRDIKPENIMLDSTQTCVKLTDFGLANLIFSEDQLLETTCGSPHYVAPEIIRGEKYSGKAADVWSLGVVLYAMCSGCLPFYSESVAKILELITQSKFEMPSDFDRNLRDLIRKMLHPDFRKRIAVKDIKSHPWWKKHCKQFYLDPSGVKSTIPPATHLSASPIHTLQIPQPIIPSSTEQHSLRQDSSYSCSCSNDGGSVFTSPESGRPSADAGVGGGIGEGGNFNGVSLAFGRSPCSSQMGEEEGNSVRSGDFDGVCPSDTESKKASSCGSVCDIRPKSPQDAVQRHLPLDSSRMTTIGKMGSPRKQLYTDPHTRRKYSLPDPTSAMACSTLKQTPPKRTVSDGCDVVNSFNKTARKNDTSSSTSSGGGPASMVRSKLALAFRSLRNKILRKPSAQMPSPQGVPTM